MKVSTTKLLLIIFTIAPLLACSLFSSPDTGEPLQTPSVPTNSTSSEEVVEEPGTEDHPTSIPASTDEPVQNEISVKGLPIAFVATGWAVKGAGKEIFLTDPDGSKIQPVSNSRETDRDPAVSWDGSRIAFTSERDGNFEIYVMDANGENQTRLTNNPAQDFHPSWSPDGKRLAFSSHRDGNSEIYVMDVDGSNLVRLTDRPAPDNYPAWSPDGSLIAFSSFGADDGTGIFVMDTAGGNVKLLAAGPLHSPAWSPDGKWIALDGDPGDCKFEVYIMQADGSDLHAITSHPDSCGGYNKHPTWSPEGDWIVFWSQRSDPKYTDLYKIKRDGSEETQITFSEINQGIYNSPTDPAWMPILVTEDANQPEFTFDYPTDWQPMSDLWPNYLPEDNYKNLGLAELVAVTSVHEQGGAGIWFVVAKRSLNGSELKAFIDQTYAQTVPEIEGLSTSTAETGAWVGLEYRYRRPWGEPWWEFRDIWFEKEGSAYLLSFHAYDLTEYEGAMQTVLDSFTFK